MEPSIPKKYGRMLINGTKKTKLKTPHSMLIADKKITARSSGISAIWKDGMRGTYLR